MKIRKLCRESIILPSATCLMVLLFQPLIGQTQKRSTLHPKKDVSLEVKEESALVEKKGKAKPPGKEKEAQNDDLKEQAYLYVTNTLMSMDSISPENKKQVAHLRAELAGLICAYGDRSKAVEIFRQSIKDIIYSQYGNNKGKGKSGEKIYGDDDANVFELLTLLRNAASKCDPSAKPLITKDLDELQLVDAQQEEGASVEKNSGNQQSTEKDPSVIFDKLLGTQPSMKRQMMSQFLTREAHEKIDAGKFDEAETLLRNSIKYCVTTPFITALVRLMQDRRMAASLLFIQAARQVQAVPSGAELASLRFGLRPLGLGNLSSKEAVSQRDKDMIEAYLIAIAALVQSKDNAQVGSSTDVTGLVKAALPAYVNFRPDLYPLIETWVSSVANKPLLSTQSKLEMPESWADRVARYEDIASNSKDPQQQDQAYASLASAMIQYGKFDKAAEWAGKISELSLKHEMLDGLIARQMSFKLAAIEESLYVSLLQAISGVTSSSLRVQLYIQLAKAVSKREMAKPEAESNLNTAYQALQEAVVVAGNMTPSSTQSHLLLNISSSYADFSTSRAFTILQEAAQSINKHEDQPVSGFGRQLMNVTVVRHDQSGTFSRTVFDDQEEYKKPYDLSVFRKLAMKDFNTSWLAAAQIDDRLLQVNAKYEVCAAILLDRKKN